MFHTYSFFTDSRLNVTEKKKILLVLRNVPLTESKAAVFPPPTTMVATCEALSVIPRREQLQLKTHPAPDRPGVEGVLHFHCFGGKRVLSFNKSWPSHSLHTIHSVTNLWQRQLKSNVILQQQIKTPLYTFIYIFIM